MQRTELASLYTATPADGTKVTVCGWAKTVRDSKNIGFISLSDGSCYKPVQIVFQADKLANYAEIAKCGLYTSFEVTGTLVLTPNAKQPFEINADTITVLGPCGPEYPLQKKKMQHGLPAHHDPSAPPHQHLQRGVPCARPGCFCPAPVLP